MRHVSLDLQHYTFWMHKTARWTQQFAADCVATEPLTILVEVRWLICPCKHTV